MYTYTHSIRLSSQYGGSEQLAKPYCSTQARRCIRRMFIIIIIYVWLLQVVHATVVDKHGKCSKFLLYLKLDMSISSSRCLVQTFRKYVSNHKMSMVLGILNDVNVTFVL